jgi:hypothetical protein
MGGGRRPCEEDGCTKWASWVDGTHANRRVKPPGLGHAGLRQAASASSPGFSAGASRLQTPLTPRPAGRRAEGTHEQVGRRVS